MNKFSFILLVVLAILAIVVFVGVGILFVGGLQKESSPSSTTNTNSQFQENLANTAVLLDQSISDGTITVSFPSKQFGLATNPQQIRVSSYIPPCDENFAYCLYYIGKEYDGTNFDSAGIRIQKRDGFQGEAECLNTPPAGYDNSVRPDSTSIGELYSTSVFLHISDAATGHYSNGSVYRLFVPGKCYELQIRISESQFQNYSAGTIKEFTDSDRQTVSGDLKRILDAISLTTGQKNLFERNNPPQPSK